ncbi:MAG: hypothetical protein HKL80_09660 [Acidimicrobiales bacterium]|nr:hypothetical protein [Acidimicrobiales bacterium]
MELDIEQRKVLTGLTRYIWWQDPHHSLLNPERLIAQVMDLGSLEDVHSLESVFSPDILRNVLQIAEPGWFRPKSWSFWHYRLMVIEVNEDPPVRPFRRYSA